MKIAVFTANGIRHKYLANTLVAHAGEGLLVSECEPQDTTTGTTEEASPAIAEHFFLRHKAETEFFAGNDTFRFQTLPLQKGELGLSYVYDVIRSYTPDLMIAFGCSIVKEPLLSLLGPGRFVNLHLGLSPYYRGSGTNFWPFVNKELEYVGGTLLHIDPGVDTGDIIAHVRPDIEEGDTVHTIGSRVITKGVSALMKIIDMVKEGKELPRTKQWEVPDTRYYKKKDFNEDILAKYYENMKGGLIENYLKGPRKELRIIDLP